MVKYYIVHKCQETACNYNPDRKPCNPGIHIQQNKSENLWDTEIKYIAQGHSNCRSRAFTTEKKYEEFLETTCGICSELISTGVPRSVSKAISRTIIKPKDLPYISDEKIVELESGKFENKSQQCPGSENEEPDEFVKPCKKRARSPETEITNKKVKRENDDFQILNHSKQSNLFDSPDRYSQSKIETDRTSHDDSEITYYSNDSRYAALLMGLRN